MFIIIIIKNTLSIRMDVKTVKQKRAGRKWMLLNKPDNGQR